MLIMITYRHFNAQRIYLSYTTSRKYRNALSTYFFIPLFLFSMLLRRKIFGFDKCAGSTKNASNNEKAKQIITIMAISTIISIRPPTKNNKGENAKIVVEIDVKIAGTTSIVPSIAERIGDFPRSKCEKIFSPITI